MGPQEEVEGYWFRSSDLSFLCVSITKFHLTSLMIRDYVIFIRVYDAFASAIALFLALISIVSSFPKEIWLVSKNLDIHVRAICSGV